MRRYLLDIETGRLTETEDLSSASVLIGVVSSRRTSDLPPPMVSPLTARQADVLKRAIWGQPTAEIAAELGLATSTVRKHLRAAYTALGVEGRRGALEIDGVSLAHGPGSSGPSIGRGGHKSNGISRGPATSP
jgi:DNA-binding CsgD family transcriptional regulator